MIKLTFSKFKKYIVYPDLSNKNLLAVSKHITPLTSYNIYFKYIFTSFSTYGPLAMKALLMLESIYPKRAESSRKLVTLRTGARRAHSSIYLKLNLEEFYSIYIYCPKKPVDLSIALNMYLQEAKYFIFPGFISLLRFPTWERNVYLTLKQPEKNNHYMFLFYKAAFID